MLEFIWNLKFKKLWFLLTISVIVKVFILLNKKDQNVDSIPIIIWWTKFSNFNKDRLISCNNGFYKCIITDNRFKNTDFAAYLFYGSHIENYDFPLPRNYSIPWAIFHEESPKNYAPFLFKNIQNIFNLTSTFSRYSDFPVTLQYLGDVDSIKTLEYYIPVELKNKYLDNIAPVLYIQSDCDTPLSRDYLVKELGKFVRIDSYGKCLTNKTSPRELSGIDPLDLYNDHLLRFISKYKFIISFENAICDDYITEKLWRPLIIGSIPIYLGSPTIEDWLPNKNSAILIKEYSNLEEVGNLINKINSNDTLYDSFLEHKIKSKISNPSLENMVLKDHPIPAFECFVCNQLHQKGEAMKTKFKDFNVYECPKPSPPEKENTWDQHWDVGKCQAKALEILLSKNVPYSSALFEHTWESLFYSKNC